MRQYVWKRRQATGYSKIAVCCMNSSKVRDWESNTFTIYSRHPSIHQISTSTSLLDLLLLLFPSLASLCDDDARGNKQSILLIPFTIFWWGKQGRREEVEGKRRVREKMVSAFIWKDNEGQGMMHRKGSERGIPGAKRRDKHQEERRRKKWWWRVSAQTTRHTVRWRERERWDFIIIAVASSLRTASLISRRTVRQFSAFRGREKVGDRDQRETNNCERTFVSPVKEGSEKEEEEDCRMTSRGRCSIIGSLADQEDRRRGERN